MFDLTHRQALWQANPDNRKQLEALFQQPWFKEAMQITADRFFMVQLVPPPGVPFLEWNATENARREGYYAALRNLHSLTKPAAAPRNTPRAWSGEHPPDKSGE